ncbi:MAG: hypothetical protein IKG62_06495, partial [Lachnospiraceae bacterium]|nr:hypothetical protein [Lachnospiraceae bacterium]
RHKREVSARNTENRRGKGPSHDRSTDEKGTINDRSTDEKGSSDIKKEREIDKRDISLLAADAEKADIYRLFFFKNFRNPEKELQRFLDRYEGNWTRTGSTRPERDHMKLARSWKPENAEPRFADPDFLPWLKTFAAWVAGCGEDPDAFIAGIKGIIVSAERRLTIIMNTPELRDRMNTELGPKMTDQDAASLIPPYRSLTIASHV